VPFLLTANTIASDLNEAADFGEPVLVRLKDNSLLCLYRTGATKPINQCYSTDGGDTWSSPMPLPGSQRGVAPDVTLLSNGALLAHAGTRPGHDIFVDFSGTGKYWKKVSWPYWDYEPENGPNTGWGCSYASIAEVEQNKILLVTTESDFDEIYRFDGNNRLFYLNITANRESDPNIYWDYIWECNEFPEEFTSDYISHEEGDVFKYVEYTPGLTFATADINDGVYETFTSGDSSSNANSQWRTYKINTNVPSTIEFKFKGGVGEMYNTGIRIAQANVGYAGFRF